MSVPTLSDVTAAWHALPAEMRNRIGIIAVDMVFQSFVSGEAYFDSLEDLPVLDEAIRDAAKTASDGRLNEMTKVVEDALPLLFGTDKAHPAWSENAGPVPTPAALAYAESVRAQDARQRRLLRSVRVRLGKRGLRLWCDRTGCSIFDRHANTTVTTVPDLDAVAQWLDRHATRARSRDAVTQGGARAAA